MCGVPHTTKDERNDDGCHGLVLRAVVGVKVERVSECEGLPRLGVPSRGTRGTRGTRTNIFRAGTRRMPARTRFREKNAIYFCAQACSLSRCIHAFMTSVDQPTPARRGPGTIPSQPVAAPRRPS